MGGYISKYAYGATYKLDNVVESTVTVDDEVSTKIVEASKEVVEASKEVVEPSKEVSKEVVEPSTEVSTKIVEPSTEVSVSSDSSEAIGIFEPIIKNKKKGKKPKKD